MNQLIKYTAMKRGMTLLEVIISVSIFAMMFIVIMALLRATQNLTHTGETLTDLQEYSQRIMERVADELRMSGRITSPPPADIYSPHTGLQYPRLGNFSNTSQKFYITDIVYGNHFMYCAQGANSSAGCGVPTGYGPTGAFTHAGVTLAQKVGTGFNNEWKPDSREIIYIVPDITKQITVQGNNYNGPFSTNGGIVWKREERALIVDHDNASNINQLIRVKWDMDTNEVSKDVLGDYVDRMVIEDIGNTPDPDGETIPSASISVDGAFSIPKGQIKVTLFMARPVADANIVLESRLTTVINMRNSTDPEAQ